VAALYSAASGFKLPTMLYYLTERIWNFNYVVMEVKLPRLLWKNYSGLMLQPLIIMIMD